MLELQLEPLVAESNLKPPMNSLGNPCRILLESGNKTCKTRKVHYTGIRA